MQILARYDGAEREGDTIRMSFSFSAENTEEIFSDKLIEGEAVTLNVVPTEFVEDNAAKWFAEATRKIAEKKKETSLSVRKALLTEYGAPLKTPYSEIYVMVEKDSGIFETSQTLFGKLTSYSFTDRTGKFAESDELQYECWTLLKPVQDYEPEEIRPLLEGTNRKMEECGIPKAEQASDRLIDFFTVQQAKRKEADV